MIFTNYLAKTIKRFCSIEVILPIAFKDYKDLNYFSLLTLSSS